MIYTSKYIFFNFFLEYTCDSDLWNKFQGHCYRVLRNPSSQPSSQEQCEALGANLASIHSVEEDKFVYKQAFRITAHQTGSWIGLNIPDGGIMSWTDDTPVDVLSFAENEPNDNNEECVVFWATNSWKWADVTCSTELPSTCKKRGLGMYVTDI